MATRVSFLADEVSTDIHPHHHLMPLNHNLQAVCVSPPWQRPVKPWKHESIGSATSLVFGLLLKVLPSDDLM